MSGPARALIHLDALRNNLARVRAEAPGARVLAVIKANGYGHGLARVARALDGADGFAVARIDEAASLREAGIEAPMLALAGAADAGELAAASRLGLDVVVHRSGQLERLERTRLERPVRVWIELDTGMHRLGLDPAGFRTLLERARACASVSECRAMTHLANADDRGDPLTGVQVERFGRAVAGLDLATSVANSAGVLGWPAAHRDWVRPGVMLYGISPFRDSVGADHGLAPAMTLETRLLAVRRARRGDAVGYGGHFVCPEDMPLGVAAIGYGDGYLRSAASGTPVLVDGRRAVIVGTVSMDTVSIDLRGHPSARPGARVVLWGRGLPVEEVARCMGTIPYELVSRIARRVEVVDVD